VLDLGKWRPLENYRRRRPMERTHLSAPRNLRRRRSACTLQKDRALQHQRAKRNVSSKYNEPLLVHDTKLTRCPSRRKAPLIIDDGGLPEVFTPEQKVAIGADGPQPVVLPASSVHSTTPKLDGFDTVTPLNLLGDQSDVVDCPFCRRRVETRVEKKPSTATQ
jgi:hypothetical protein